MSRAREEMHRGLEIEIKVMERRHEERAKRIKEDAEVKARAELQRR